MKALKKSTVVYRGIVRSSEHGQAVRYNTEYKYATCESAKEGAAALASQLRVGIHTIDAEFEVVSQAIAVI